MSLRARVRRHPLVAFVVLAYLLSWSYWIPLAWNGAVVVPGGSVTHLPGLLGPALAALLVPLLAGDREALADLLRRMRLVTRPVWRFGLVSLSPLVFLGLALPVAAVTGAPLPDVSDFARYSGLPVLELWAVVPIVFVVNGLGEETGWRGFALPRLQQRFGPLGGTLVLAVIWAAWHVPLFQAVETYRLMTPATMLFGFGLGI
ncbi:MAG TPA: CPBP family intramembrane glutamic endopeptidase, partial [Actinomycetota bacterium]|nr:CPBP family intramembrane glutamic endopeptidase [Actinomycetota bacterium]